MRAPVWNPLRALFPNRKSSLLADLIEGYLTSGYSSGGPVTEDQAMRLAAVDACVQLIAGTVGSLPLHMYQRRADGGKERQAGNSLEGLLRKPNAWQTAMDFREQLTVHLLLRGNAFAWIEWVQQAQGGQVVHRPQRLIPLHPDRMDVEQADWNEAPRYFLRRKNGSRMELPAEDVFHIRGLSTNGVLGRSVLADARETLGVALSTQRYAGRLFDHDATPGVVLKHPGRLSKDAAERLKASWDEDHAGQARTTAVLEEGMTLERLTITPEDAQFLETRKLQRSEICGRFLVPPHMIGDVDKSTSWGTGIEQQQIGFLVYTLRRWLVRWEQAIWKALIERDDTYFVQHAVEGLLRGDSQARGQFYNTLIPLGVMTRNEARALENLNPLPGLDTPLQPLNMGPAGGTP
jgi:HK97 family phage portal protein